MLTDEVFNSLSLARAAEGIRSRSLTPLALVEKCLERIEGYDHVLKAFITRLGEQALAEADYATKALKRGEDWGPLHGIPLAIKDMIDVTDAPTTNGSDFFRENVAHADAEVVMQLQAAGAIIMGKTNMHELAVGVTTTNPHFGTCRNPWNPAHVPGGSSGGSAAAVAAGMSLGALGTDTGGSVRVPAALCGLTGLRPGKGRISRLGVFPMSWTLDEVGPLAHSVEDVALLYDALSVHGRTLSDRLERSPRGLRIGLPMDDLIWMEINHQVAAVVRSAVNLLAGLGADVVEIELPMLAEAQTAAGLIGIIEAAAIHRERLDSEPERFGADVRARLGVGADRSGIDYALARQRGREWREALSTAFNEGCDLLILPTCSTPAPEVEGTDSVAAAKELLRFTYPFSLSGYPVLNLPVGFSTDGLPIGMQVIAPQLELLLQAGHAYQQHTDWHKQRPDLAGVTAFEAQTPPAQLTLTGIDEEREPDDIDG